MEMSESRALSRSMCADFLLSHGTAKLPHISPHWAIVTSRFGTSLPRYPVLVFSIFLTTSMPSTTWPKTTCLPSRKGVGTVVMKNCEPLVLGPPFYCPPGMAVSVQFAWSCGSLLGAGAHQVTKGGG